MRPAAAILLMGLAGWTACAPTLRYPAKGAVAPPIHELWQEPRDLAKRDLFHGVGGRDLVPNPRGRYEYLAEDTTGASPGYRVRDDRGLEWDVKLGEEVQSEVVLSRFLWAVGFHQPPTYYMDYGWTLSEAPGWLKGAAGAQSHARFRPHLPNHQKAGEWSWYDNPFVGTRAFNGLLMANLIFANWDYKTNNNRIYEVEPRVGDASRLFVVQDLGAALGKESPNFLSRIRLRALRGSKNVLEDFERTGFIRRVDGNGVEFEYDGMDRALFENIAPADVQWLCGLFARLTDQQWNDAFRAAGYPDETRARYISKIKKKIAQGVAL
jgi:hypothetical protein